MSGSAFLDGLKQAGEERILTPGEVLCVQGEESDSAFVVIDGSIETVISTDAGPVVLGQHGPGSLIGEVTALVGGQRTATLRATQPTTVRVVASARLRTVFDEHPEEATARADAARDRTDRSRVAALLANQLDTSDEAAISAIAAAVTWEPLDAGQVLFEAGDEADAGFLVLSGRLGVCDDDGAVFEQVGRGGIVGEFGLLEGRTRTATVKAMRDSTVARLDRQDFANIMAKHTKLAMGLVRHIVERSGRETSQGTLVGRSACVIVTGPGNPRIVTTRMVEALDRLGPTAHLWPARVDEMLGAAGASSMKPGAVGDVRLVELLHQVDADHDHVFLEGHVDHPDWTVRAIRRADQVVVVCSADPPADEERRIREILDAVPEETSVWLALNHPAGTDRVYGTAETRERFGVAEVHHVIDAAPGDLGRVARLAVGKGFGLALSGGGARGFAHIGVMEALESHDVPVDRIAGASMGAVIGAGIAQPVAPNRRVEVTRTQFANLLDYTVPIVSVIKGRAITKSLAEQWGNFDMEDLRVPFACVTTNLTTSEVVTLRRGPTDFAVRASTAIPGVLPPVPYEGDLLIDGGVLDNLPVGLFSDDPSIGTVMAVDVTPPRGPRAKSDYGLSVSGLAVLRDRLLRRKTRYPGLASVLMRTMLIGSARDRDRAVLTGEVDLYLDLELKGIGLLDFDTVDKVAKLGYEVSVDRIGAWWAERNGSVV